jgi:hypothetical protein
LRGVDCVWLVSIGFSWVGNSGGIDGNGLDASNVKSINLVKLGFSIISHCFQNSLSSISIDRIAVLIFTSHLENYSPGHCKDIKRSIDLVNRPSDHLRTNELDVISVKLRLSSLSLSVMSFLERITHSSYKATGNSCSVADEFLFRIKFKPKFLRHESFHGVKRTFLWRSKDLTVLKSTQEFEVVVGMLRVNKVINHDTAVVLEPIFRITLIILLMHKVTSTSGS